MNSLKLHKILFIALYLILVLFILLYFGVFEVNYLSYYLIATPFVVFIVPYILLLVYTIYFGSNHYKISIILVLILIVLEFGITRINTFSNNHEVSATYDQQVPVRICSWNTAFFFKWDMDLGFSTLTKNNCDIIALQEVWRSDLQLELIKKYRDLYLKDYKFINDKEYVTLTKNENSLTSIESVSEGFLASKIYFKDKLITVFNTHIWNPLAPKPTFDDSKIVYLGAIDTRTEQKTELTNKTQEIIKSGSPVVVVGDFNTLQNDPFIRKLEKLSQQQTNLRLVNTPIFANPNTYSTRNRLIQIDYSYVSTDVYENSKKTLICINGASDHCLIILDILL